MGLLRQDRLPELTSRERAVSDLLLLGWDNAAIAEELKVCSSNIRRTLTGLYKRPGVCKIGRNARGKRTSIGKRLSLALWLRRGDPKTLRANISAKLTSIEEDVVNLVHCGLENEDIAAMISDAGRGQTVEGDVENILHHSDEYGRHDSIFNRLGVNNRVGLALLQEDRLYSIVTAIEDWAISTLWDRLSSNWELTSQLGQEEIKRQVQEIRSGCRGILISMGMMNSEACPDFADLTDLKDIVAGMRLDKAWKVHNEQLRDQRDQRQKLKQKYASMTEAEKDGVLREFAAQEKIWQDSQFAPRAA